MSSRYTRLHTNGKITVVDELTHCIDGGARLRTVCMTVDENALTALAAQQVIERRVERLGFDVPQGNVDGRQCGHVHRPTLPVGTAIEVMPNVFDRARVATDER
jgi:hypothetical protein